MQSQIQCPVCTLYLHVGMNLQAHLDTHPKDQVIKALVNFTLLQQNTNQTENEDRHFECSTYAPLSSQDTNCFQNDRYSAYSGTAGSSSGEPLQNESTNHSGRPQSNIIRATTSEFTNNSIASISPKAANHSRPPIPFIATDPTVLPPPPSYEASTLNLHPPINRSSYEPQEVRYLAANDPSVVDVAAAAPVQNIETNVIRRNVIQHSDLHSPLKPSHQSSSVIQNSIAAPKPSPVVLNPTLSTSQMFLSANQSAKLTGRRKSGLQILSNVRLNPNEKLLMADLLTPQNNIDESGPVHEPELPVDASKTLPETEVDEKIEETEMNEPLEIPKDSVDNSVQTENGHLNVEKININNDDEVICQGAVSKTIAETDNKDPNLKENVNAENCDDMELEVNIEQIDTGKKTQISNTKVEIATPISVICRAISSVNKTVPQKHSSMLQSPKKQQSPPLETLQSSQKDESPQSGQSQELKHVQHSEPSQQPQHSQHSEKPRPLVKKPFVKTPKRLVVKFKKPFVPITEEDNDNATQIPNIYEFKSEPEIDITDDNTKNETNLCCPETDVPFSPLRDSFTPTPNHINVLNQDAEETEENFENKGSLNEESKTEESRSESQENNKDIDDAANGQECMEFTIRMLDKDNAGTLIDEEKPSETNAPIQQIPEMLAHASEESWTTEMLNQSTAVRVVLDDEQQQQFNDNDDDNKSEEIFSVLSTVQQPQTCETAIQSHHQYVDQAGPSRMDYGFSSLIAYTNTVSGNCGDDFYSNVPLSPIGYSPSENYAWNQKFSPSYVSFDMEKNSYVDLDNCRATNDERAPSADSLNIRTDEKMPAKGEISEQESNGDVDGSWSHQIFPLQDALPRYTSSYDTTVARESWSLSNDQNGFQENVDHLSTVMPKFTPICSAVEEELKPDLLAVDTKITNKTTKVQKVRKYRCPECPKTFSILKDKRNHLVDVHEYQPYRNKTTCTVTRRDFNVISSTESSSNGISSAIAGGSSSCITVKVKSETITTQQVKNMNQHLLNFNWSVLRQKLTQTEDVKIPLLPTEDNVFMCLVCHERFYSIKSFNSHFIVHPAECYTCGRVFKHWVNFSIHLKRHLNIKEYACVHCSKRFVLRQNLMEHLNTHSGETPFHCKFCTKRFRRYSNLVQHRNRYHLNIRPKEKDYICQCGEVFHSVAKFVWHKETHDKKPKCCPYCRERFMHRNSLSRHVRLSHTNYFPIFSADSLVECPICQKKYIKSSLKNHLLMHTTISKYDCNICNKRFTTKWNLKQHKWIHASRSLKPYKCNLCSKAFIRETEYQSHINTHKSIKPYTCDHCGCQFARKYNWIRHAREHEVPKRHRCDECGKVFHRAYYLTEHKRSHTGERPFECVICGKTSTTKTNHNKHVKIHHARDPLTAEG